MKDSSQRGRFSFKPIEAKPIGTVLYQEHLSCPARAHLAEFAGYIMPLWFSSISAEHAAVRNAAGLFDCTHMGIIEITGPEAEMFVNQLTTNDVSALESHRAQYSYILDAAGNVLDDVIVYRRDKDNFMMVVNAANEPKIKAYLAAIQNQEVIVDIKDENRKLPNNIRIRDMRQANNDADCRVDIALQGPTSLEIISELLPDEDARCVVADLKAFHFAQAELAGIDCIISRTGYTGSKIGFELFVQPDRAVELWRILLKTGKSFGITPCGLGARDSLRIEAGLPLYGHELAGPYNISPFEAGYFWAVKLEKDFFIGQDAMIKKAANIKMHVARVELPGTGGIRPVRAGDAILANDDRCVGFVLSCAKIDKKQIALVYGDKNILEPGTEIGLYYIARNQSHIQKGRKQKAELGQVLKADITGTVINRFAKF